MRSLPGASSPGRNPRPSPGSTLNTLNPSALTQPALDYYEAHLTHLESELIMFVAKNGELPPAVEDGGIFSLYEIHSDIAKIKREGLKLYMRKDLREA